MQASGLEESTSLASCAVPRQSAERPGISPGFLSGGTRTGRGGHAFFVGAGDFSPASGHDRSGRNSSPQRSASALSGHGGRMFFVDIADGPRKAPPKPPQPGFMRSAERRLHVNTHAGGGTETGALPAASETSSSMTPSADAGSEMDGWHRAAGTDGGKGGQPSAAARGLRPWQRHMRGGGAAGANHGRLSGAASLTASPAAMPGPEPPFSVAVVASEDAQPPVTADMPGSAAEPQHTQHAAGEHPAQEAEEVDLSMTLSPAAFAQQIRKLARASASGGGSVRAAQIAKTESHRHSVTAQRSSASQHGEEKRGRVVPQAGGCHGVKEDGFERSASSGDAVESSALAGAAEGSACPTAAGEQGQHVPAGSAEEEQGPGVYSTRSMRSTLSGAAGREQLPTVGQGADEAARMLAELVAEHEDSLMDTARSVGSAARGGEPSAGMSALRQSASGLLVPPNDNVAGDEASSTPHHQRVAGGPPETVGALHVTTAAADGGSGLITSAAPDSGYLDAEPRAGRPAMDAKRGDMVNVARDVSPGVVHGRSRSPRARNSQPESPSGPDLEQLMAGLRAQLAALPLSPRSAAERRRGTEQRPTSAPSSPMERVHPGGVSLDPAAPHVSMALGTGDRYALEVQERAGGQRAAQRPVAERSAHSASPHRRANLEHPADTAATGRHALRPQSPADPLRAARSKADGAQRTSSRSPPAPQRTERVTTDGAQRTTSRSPPSRIHAARSTADKLHSAASRSINVQLRAARSTADGVQRTASRSPPAPLRTARSGVEEAKRTASRNSPAPLSTEHPPLTDRNQRTTSRSPPAPPSAARSRARSTADTLGRTASHSPAAPLNPARSTEDREPGTAGQAAAATQLAHATTAAPAATVHDALNMSTRDLSLRHMHEHPQSRHEASRTAATSDKLGAELRAPKLDQGHVSLKTSTGPVVAAAEPREHEAPLRAAASTLSLSRDSLVAPDGPVTTSSVESFLGSADSAAGLGEEAYTHVKPTLRTASTLRESRTMAAVPEDAALEGPLQSPVREFLERSSGAGASRFSSAERRSVRKAALYAPQPRTRSESDTTVASAEQSVSVGGARGGPAAAGVGDSAAHSHGSTSVVNSSDFQSARAGASEDRDGRSPRAPYEVGRTRNFEERPHLRESRPAQSAGSAAADGSTSEGSGWAASGGVLSDSAWARGGVLDSDGSSICLPAPTLRPSTLQGTSSVLISTSSLSSDAANPISTPKKKQRCDPPLHVSRTSMHLTPQVPIIDPQMLRIVFVRCIVSRCRCCVLFAAAARHSEHHASARVGPAMTPSHAKCVRRCHHEGEAGVAWAHRSATAATRSPARAWSGRVVVAARTRPPHHRQPPSQG